MARVLVTGSSDGIGAQTARDLVAGGHEVVVHARDDRRAEDARAAVPGACAVVVGDLTSMTEVHRLAEQARTSGRIDVVVHNAGIGAQPGRQLTGDGFERTFQVNTLAPYLLTALLPRPERLVYLTSGLESEGRVDLEDLQYEHKPWDGRQAYSDSKLHDVLLAFAVARLWPQVRSNAVDPGWIRTSLGGPHATDDLPEGAETQVWLATSDEPGARVTGQYLKRRQSRRANEAAYDVGLQDRLLACCAELTGVQLGGDAGLGV